MNRAAAPNMRMLADAIHDYGRIAPQHLTAKLYELPSEERV
jgi:hypothetical protein